MTLPKILIRHRRPLVVAAHLALIPVGYFMAFVLRYDLPLPDGALALFWSTLPYVVVLRMTTFAFFGLYSGWWRHVSIGDLVALFKAVTLSSGLFLFSLSLLGLSRGLPPSILVLDWVVSIFLIGGIRLSVRVVRRGRLTWRNGNGGKRTIIVGAGEAGERLLRQFWRNGEDMHPVAVVDDDQAKRGMRLHDVPVLGTSADLPQLVAQHQIEMIVIATPSATRQQMQQIVSRSMEAGVEFKIVPSIREMLDGRVRLSELRNVEIEDLLGRDPVRLDMAAVERDILGKTVMITGGAGSIGSELARQIAHLGPARIILLEQAESPLYFVHLELSRAHPDLEVVPVIADITDETRLRSVFAVWRPQYVFHAAAYKHVPLMEENVVEAVRNNVLGTLRVAQCAAQHLTEKFVLISTDKAVHPSSVMGATKGIAERIVLGWPTLTASSTDFRVVRFGNVLGSDGSVVPLFRKQLARGEPLTVTHRDVTRYFMTIPEAVQLVLQASAIPETCGKIAMLEMGEPVRIVDLAENLIRLSGLEPYRDVPIIFTGLRPGEKLHEELISTIEETVPTPVEKIRVVESQPGDEITLARGIDRLAAAVEAGSNDDLLQAICALVPDCVSPLRELGLSAARSRQYVR